MAKKKTVKKSANQPASKAGKKATVKKKPVKAIKKKKAPAKSKKKKGKKKRKRIRTILKSTLRVDLSKIKSEPRSQTTRISFNQKEKSSLNRSAGRKPVKGRAVNPFLYFNGNCEEAFNFYKGIFGGRFTYLGCYREMPGMGDQKITKESWNKIMQITYPISKETVLMGADMIPELGGKVNVGTNFAVSLEVSSIGEAKRLFRALSYQGVITFPQENTFWGAFFGMCIDKFSVHWMISCETRS